MRWMASDAEGDGSTCISTGDASNMLKLAHHDLLKSGRQDEVFFGYISVTRCGQRSLVLQGRLCLWSRSSEVDEAEERPVG
jgi:hypothetical protein